MDTAKAILLLTQAQQTITAALAELAPAPAAPVVPTPPAAPVGRVPENPSGTVAGLSYQYYEGKWDKLPDFSKLTPTSTGYSLKPDLSGRKVEDFFAFRYAGYLYVPATAEYTFYTTSDDGSRLSIGSAVVVLNDGVHGPQEAQGKLLLQKGWHALTLEYFEYNNGQVLEVSYSSPALGKTMIPASAYARLGATTNAAVNPTAANLTAKVS